MKIKHSDFISLKDLDDAFATLSVPLELFNSLMNAVKNNDYSLLEDTVTKTRFLSSKDKVSEHVNNSVYQNVYKGETYDSIIEILIDIYAIIDSLVDNRRYITDISRQNYKTVVDFLESFGFSIHPIIGENVSKNVARQIYYYLRKKGTPNIISIFLNKLGFSHYVINEYDLTRKNCKWVFAPETIYATASMRNRNYEYKDIPISEVDDPLWWIEEEDLNKFFYDELDTCPDMIRDGTKESIINPLKGLRSNIKSIMLRNFGEFDYYGEIVRDSNDVSLNAVYNEQFLKESKANQRADIIHTISRLQLKYPNLDTVWLEIPWFVTGDVTNVGGENQFIIDSDSKATIKPYVHASLKNEFVATNPNIWEIKDGGSAPSFLPFFAWAGLNYNLTNTSSHTVNYMPATPSDNSVIWLIGYLKSLGFKVGLYPIIKHNLDLCDRSNIKITDRELFIDFKFNYSEIYKHYGSLYSVVAYDYLSIGSGMTALTSAYSTLIYDESAETTSHFNPLINTVIRTNSYVDASEYIRFNFIDILKELAKSIKQSHSSLKLVYAANYDEYAYEHGTTIYHMDMLYTDPNIDYVGINAYFPHNPEHTNNFKTLLNGMQSNLYWDKEFKTYPTDKRTLTTSKRNGYGFNDQEFQTVGMMNSLKNVKRWYAGQHWSKSDLEHIGAMSEKKIWQLDIHTDPESTLSPFGESGSFVGYNKPGAYWDSPAITDSWFVLNDQNYISGYHPINTQPLYYELDIKFTIDELPHEMGQLVRFATNGLEDNPEYDYISIFINYNSTCDVVLRKSNDDFCYTSFSITTGTLINLKLICDSTIYSVMVNDVIIDSYTGYSGTFLSPSDDSPMFINSFSGYSNFCTGKLYQLTIFDLTNNDTECFDFRFEDRIRGYKSMYTPRCKPLMFTEIGCPSISSACIEPNIEPKFYFADPIIPRNSSGISDEDHQARVLKSAMDHWVAQNITSMMTVSCYDARPWEIITMKLPNGTYYYGDYINYQYNKCINGKMIDMDEVLI